VKVRVVQQPVTEGSVTYLKNQTFFVTPERFAELGSFVVPVLAPAKPETVAAAPAMVRVTVLDQPVDENGATYTKGQTFITTAERAKEISALVSIAE
jgi:hypothetical protein